MQEALCHVLDLGAIVKCKEVQGQFLSSIFLIPKSNGKMRLILNLKQLNRFVETENLKKEDIRTALKLVSKGYYMANLDLQDAYFTIPIHEESRKFLRFRWNDPLYEFVCMPFGLSTAPWVFSKILKPVVGFLRSSGWISVVYLDDWLLVAESQSHCKENIDVSKNLLVFGFYCEF